MKNLLNSKWLTGTASVIGALAISTLAFAQINSKSKSNGATSNEHLFKLGVALLQYSDDYDGKLPFMHNVGEVKEVLGPFAPQEAFLQPENKQSYQPNQHLSGRIHSSFNGKKVVAFYEASPRSDGTRLVLFLPIFDHKIVHYEWNSGFVKNDIQRLGKNEWLRVKPAGVKYE